MTAFSKKMNFLTRLFSVGGILVFCSCVKFNPDESADTGASVNKTETAAPAVVYEVPRDALGRGTISLIARETHDVSADLDLHSDKDVASFKIIRPTGEVHFEATGGLPDWSVFKLPLRSDPYTLEITTADGDIYTRSM